MGTNMPYEPMQVEHNHRGGGGGHAQFGSSSGQFQQNNPFQQINQAFSQGRGYENFVHNNNFQGNMSYPGGYNQGPPQQQPQEQQVNPNQFGNYPNNQPPPNLPGSFNPFDLLRRQ